MSIHDAMFAMVDALHQNGSDYLLVGSLAASYYGLARSTTDADFVVQLQPSQLSEVVRQMGHGYQLDPQPGFEIFTGKRVNVVHVLGTHFKIDVFPLTDDPFDQERFRRRSPRKLSGRDVFLPTAEDVLVMKIRWRRSQDLEDARYLIAVQPDRLDWSYIESWCDVHGTRTVLDEVRRSVPPI
jgi:hypothetical protein